MKKSVVFTVRAVPWRRGWELHIDGHGVTQVRVLADAAQQVRDYVETVTGRDVSGAEVTLRYDLQGLEREVVEVRRRTSAAAELQLEAAAAARELVAELRSKGLSVSDIAHVMDLSRGRISQLLAG